MSEQIWQCVGCGRTFVEYVNGCPHHGDVETAAPRVELVENLHKIADRWHLMDDTIVMGAEGWRITFSADPVGWTLEEIEDNGTPEDHPAATWTRTAWFLSSQDAEQWLVTTGFPRAARTVGRMVRILIDRSIR